VLKINIMEWFKNKFLDPGDPTVDVDGYNTLIVHLHYPLCLIRIVLEGKGGPDWKEPVGVVKKYEQVIPEDERAEDYPSIWKYTLWIFRPEHIPDEERSKYEAILDAAWRYYIEGAYEED